MVVSTTRDPELEAFKVHIDLRSYAADRGYAFDSKESWRGSSVMRHTNGDKIIVKIDHDRHYVYFSVRDESDNGSIIDFVQKRGGRSLGAVRQILRPWIGKAAAIPSLFPALIPTTKDRMEIERLFRMMEDAPRHPYLEKVRCVPLDLLSSPRFLGRIKRDKRGNAVFPHFDLEGLCGYEIKNEGYTGFSKGGEKGLWFSQTEKDDKRLVLCESAIDALSLAVLFPVDHTRYASIGGQMNPKQPALIKATMLRLPSDAEVVAAMDADGDGHRYAELVRQTVIETARDDLRFVLQEPDGVKDWNDALRNLNHSAFTTFIDKKTQPLAR